MAESVADEVVPPLHFGPVYGDRLVPRGDSLAACRPGPHKPASMTTHKPWVTCEACKQSEAYRNG